MKYLSIDGGFKDDVINVILETDIRINDDIYNKFFELQSQGKEFKIKNINGITFEEIFEEFIPALLPQQITEEEKLKEQLNTMQGAVDFIIMNY